MFPTWCFGVTIDKRQNVFHKVGLYFVLCLHMLWLLGKFFVFSAKDFIRHLMCKDPSQRYSCKQAIAHPWWVKICLIIAHLWYVQHLFDQRSGLGVIVDWFHHDYSPIVGVLINLNHHWSPVCLINSRFKHCLPWSKLVDMTVDYPWRGKKLFGNFSRMVSASSVESLIII